MNKKVCLATILFLMIAYCVISIIVYRFKHTSKTDTELFLEIPKALLWRQ